MGRMCGMADYYNAFEMSPVPDPAEDAVAPEPHRGIYAMPMFLISPTTDMAASTQFWLEGLGFIDLFSVPGQLVHLRRWAFQDVLLVPGEQASEAPALTVSFSCVQSQIPQVAAACEELLPGSTSGPRQTPWNTTDLEVTTPERARVVMTAARPYDPDSPQARSIREMGIRYHNE